MYPNNQNMTVDDLWMQLQGYQDNVGSQLDSLQNILSSGNVQVAGADGLSRVAGGTNRYGEIRPDTVLMRDASGNLDPRFQQTMSPEFLALQQKGMTEGDTESARLARERLGVMTQADRDSLQRQSASGINMGMRNLAMRGGAGTGSRERLQRDMGRNLMSGQQNIGRENRLANLGISAQDEAMKNQLMSQTGMIGQQIQEGNINRLQQDIQAQNVAAHSIYGEDMAAYAAQQSANAQAAAACFTGETMIKMIDGSLKPILEVRLGDKLFEGGKVNYKCEALTNDLYMYDRKVNVSGTHAVKENGKWIRVQDSEKSKKITGEWAVFNLGTENHIIISGDTIFSDFFETDFYEQLTIDESLDVLNGRVDKLPN